MFRSRDSQVISDNNNLFNYTYVRNVAHMHLLTGDKLIPPPSYSPTMLSEPKLDPKCAMRKLNKPLHHVLPPICATTKHHCALYSSTLLLSPYLTPLPNAESILSAFSTPFNPHEQEHPAIYPRCGRQAFFITGGGPFSILDITGLYNEHEQGLSSPKVQSTYKHLGEGTRV
ncbi:hypothetical protein BKA82DRAFT_3986249 [Pisolithus tinctorius]|nr:hypothetical protein BKA82DRAFT_3986249 [Pisolithus tinctorius]